MVVEGLFSSKQTMPFSLKTSKIDQSVPIVVETEQISDRQNSPLKSRAEVFDGLSGGPLPYAEKICAC
jgi:hypothetical protein